MRGMGKNTSVFMDPTGNWQDWPKISLIRDTFISEETPDEEIREMWLWVQPTSFPAWELSKGRNYSPPHRSDVPEGHWGPRPETGTQCSVVKWTNTPGCRFWLQSEAGLPPARVDRDITGDGADRDSSGFWALECPAARSTPPRRLDASEAV